MAKRKETVEKAREKYGVSQRKACRALSICRNSVRSVPIKRKDEDEITAKNIDLASNYGRYGYRRITAMLNINHKRVERILNDGSCIRLRPEYRNHVWSYAFVEDRLRNGRKIRWLNIIDEYTRACLSSIPRRHWKHTDVIHVLADLFITKGVPSYIRSDNGTEFTANQLRKWLHNLGVSNAYIEPGSPWENGFCESFNSKMRDEFLNREIFDSMVEVEILTKRWILEYNTI